MEQPRKNFAIWLEPAAIEREFFTSLILDLAQRTDAPVFAPHLTLHGGDVEADTALRALESATAESNYELEIEGVDFSASFTRTLFVRFRPTKALTQLRAALGDLLSLPDNGDFDSHLSLLYKAMPLSEKAELARGIRLIFTRASFTGLSVIAHPSEIKTKADVEAWEAVRYRPLDQRSR